MYSAHTSTVLRCFAVIAANTILPFVQNLAVRVSPVMQAPVAERLCAVPRVPPPQELWTSFLLLASDQRIEVCRPTLAGSERAAAAEVNLADELRCRSASSFVSAGRPALAVLTTSNQVSP